MRTCRHGLYACTVCKSPHQSALKNPHMRMTALDPPRAYPPRRWLCLYCGMAGLFDQLRGTACTHLYPPCAACGQTPECAPDCRAVLEALAGARVIG